MKEIIWKKNKYSLGLLENTFKWLKLPWVCGFVLQL